jgi:hypothetical protein
MKQDYFKSTYKNTLGASDVNLVVMVLAIAVIFAVVTKFNSCVERRKYEKMGWVEVEKPQ